MGGTFMSLPADYRDYFIRNLHDALSGHSSVNVEEAISYSEHGSVKCIGMTIETWDFFFIFQFYSLSEMTNGTFKLCIVTIPFLVKMSCYKAPILQFVV